MQPLLLLNPVKIVTSMTVDVGAVSQVNMVSSCVVVIVCLPPPYVT